MPTEEELSDQALEAWDFNGPVYEELERRFSSQFAERLLNDDAMPGLRTLYLPLAERKPLALLTDHLGDGPVPPFSPNDPDYHANYFFPPELRATAATFFRTAIDLATRYADEFIARNADLGDSAPEHNREHHLLNRTLDQVLIRIERHFSGPLDDAVVEFGVS